MIIQVMKIILDTLRRLRSLLIRGNQLQETFGFFLPNTPHHFKSARKRPQTQHRSAIFYGTEKRKDNRAGDDRDC